jgi:OmpA-OmpF porin, OOP family
MIKQHLRSLMMAVPLAVLAACSSSPTYTPVATKADALNPAAYTKKVDNFVVLLDTSGSMKTDDTGRPRIQTAQDVVASFNSLVPPLGYKAGMVTFGKGTTGSCIGYGVANTIYGLAPYNSASFGQALGSIGCAASTTPYASAVGSATTMLVEEKGPIAVFIVSDFSYNWHDPAAVESALADLKAQHPGKVCVHIIKIGEGDADIAGLTDTAGCDSVVKAADLATGAAMSNYVVKTLLTPVDQPLQYEKHTVSAQALFDFDKYVLKPQGIAELQSLGASIRSQGLKVREIDVVGHTDSVGSDAYNMRLSERRAMAVRNFLVSEGVSSSIIHTSGMGKRDPVASNDTAEGRALNRRVEVIVGTARPTN